MQSGILFRYPFGEFAACLGLRVDGRAIQTAGAEKLRIDIIFHETVYQTAGPN
jgi:hypothetical protein